MAKTEIIKLAELLNEGVYDPGILKAVFLAGGPGSGKTFVTKQLFGVPDKINISYTGMKMVNSDTELETLLKKYGFGTDLDKMPKEVFYDLTHKDTEELGASLRSFAKELTAQRKKLYMNGRLGLIIDGTGRNYNNIQSQQQELKDLGYDTFMVFVNTSLAIAQKRNMARARKLDPKFVELAWNGVQENIGKFHQLFGKNFVVVDNSKFLNDPEKHFGPIAKQHIDKFAKAPVKNKIGRRWIENQKILKAKK